MTYRPQSKPESNVAAADTRGAGAFRPTNDVDTAPACDGCVAHPLVAAMPTHPPAAETQWKQEEGRCDITLTLSLLFNAHVTSEWSPRGPH